MEYSLQQLEHSIKAFKSSNDAKYYADQIKHLAYTISEGNRLTANQVDKLTDIITMTGYGKSFGNVSIADEKLLLLHFTRPMEETPNN